MKLDDLKQTLEQALSSLPAQAVSQAQEEASFLDLSQDPDDSRWKRLLAGALRDARRFELHCWNEEADCLALALKYGGLQASDWQFGKIVAGPVTPEFSAMLLALPKPEDTGLDNRMTPFFNVFLDDCFHSSHYGTEVYLQ